MNRSHALAGLLFSATSLLGSCSEPKWFMTSEPRWFCIAESCDVEFTITTHFQNTVEANYVVRGFRDTGANRLERRVHPVGKVEGVVFVSSKDPVDVIETMPVVQSPTRIVITVRRKH